MIKFNENFSKTKHGECLAIKDKCEGDRLAFEMSELHKVTKFNKTQHNKR
jgi:hypothetical protein